RERQFFAHLWKARASVFGTYFWFLWHQLRLVWEAVRQGRYELLCIYLPLQVVGFAALTMSLFRYRRLYREFLIDVRMYLEPRGLVERAIVERIDHRVGKAFLQLLGLDLEFRPLLP